MRHIQRMSLRMTPEQRRQVEDLGFEVPPGYLLGSDTPLVTFDAAEDHPNWPTLCGLFKQWNIAPFSERTEFTPRELDEARWLQLGAWHNGYALPQDDMKFFEVTFDTSHACSLCGFGKIQKAPYRIKMEPKWGRKGIMSLIWASDELFVPPAIWETVFKRFGIECRQVANAKGNTLKTVVQLIIAEEADVAPELLIVRDHCKTCGRSKYERSSRGYYPRLASELSGALAKTRQTFRAGWDCRDILVSQNLRQAMLAHNIRGAEFIPVDHALPAVVA